MRTHQAAEPFRESLDWGHPPTRIPSRGMRRRDKEASRREILEAALEEFGAHGLKGGRVERVAQRAGGSIGLIYRHFGNKEALFDEMFNTVVAEIRLVVPFDETDPATYAAEIVDRQREYPSITRLAEWDRLERGDRALILSISESLQETCATLRVAQEAGNVSDRFTPEETLLLTFAVAGMWSALSPEIVDLIPDQDRRRDLVRRAVNRLVSS